MAAWRARILSSAARHTPSTSTGLSASTAVAAIDTWLKSGPRPGPEIFGGLIPDLLLTRFLEEAAIGNLTLGFRSDDQRKCVGTGRGSQMWEAIA